MAWTVDVAWGLNSTAGGASTSVIYTFPSAVSQGALLVCFGQSQSTVNHASVTDSVNGAWTEFGVGSPQVGNSRRWSGWYFANSAAGTPQVELHFSSQAGAGSTVGSRVLAAGSYVGIATASPFDTGAGIALTNPSTTADAIVCGPTGQTAQDPELAIAAMALNASNDTIVGTAGWNQRILNSTTLNGGFQIEDKNITPTQTVSASWTITVNGNDPNAILGTFKEASVAGGGRIGPRFGLLGVGF